MRKRLRILRTLIAGGFACACSAASAQIAFVEANASVGLTHVNSYGQTFEFADIGPPFTPSIGAAMQRNMGNGAAVGDYDRDGDLDLYLLNPLGTANSLWRNDVNTWRLGFTEVSADAGVGDTGFARVAFFADLDNDGWQDLFLANRNEQGVASANVLYMNNGDGTWCEVATTLGVDFPTLNQLSYAPGDIDNDGDLDIVLVSHLFGQPNIVLRNDARGKITSMASPRFVVIRQLQRNRHSRASRRSIVLNRSWRAMNGRILMSLRA